MATFKQTIPTSNATPAAEIKVWDPLLRIFHWSLVALFVAAYATGDEIEKIHVVIGYAIAGLLAIRVIWGFIGSKHARFTDFVTRPAIVMRYLTDAMAFRARRYIGHNPAGGAMIMALLGSLTATALTGYMLTTGPYWGVKWVEEVHEVCANITVALVVLHVMGVVGSSLMHGENLVKAMITGRKRAED